MHLVNDEMKSCIAECLLRRRWGIVGIGGQHTEPKHLTLMTACAFHASRLGTAQTHLSRMRRDLRTMRRGL
jgi:hypothetical protein